MPNPAGRAIFARRQAAAQVNSGRAAHPHQEDHKQIQREQEQARAQLAREHQTSRNEERPPAHAGIQVVHAGILVAHNRIMQIQAEHSQPSPFLSMSGKVSFESFRAPIINGSSRALTMSGTHGISSVGLSSTRGNFSVAFKSSGKLGISKGILSFGTLRFSFKRL